MSQKQREKFPAPPGFTELSDVDLSHLDPKEMAAILEVAARAQEIDQLENRKVRNIQKQVESFSNQKLPTSHAETKKTENKNKRNLHTTDAGLSGNQGLGNSETEGGANKKKQVAKNVEIHKKHSGSDSLTKRSGGKSTPKRESSEKKATSEPKIEMPCSMCSTVTSVDAQKDDESSRKVAAQDVKERCDEINEFKKHLKCSSCGKFICKSCASSSVLAKKGDLLCQLCLKRKELAAHEWLSNKLQTAPLFRSASAEIPFKVGSLNKSENKSSDSRKLSSRSRSYSGSHCSSSSSHKNSGVKELEPGKQISDSRVNEISTSEALVRRLSQDELVQKELQKNKMERNTSKAQGNKKAVIEDIAEETEISQKESKKQNNATSNSKKVVGVIKNEEGLLPSDKNSEATKSNKRKEALKPTTPKKGAVPYLTELKRKLSFKIHSDLNVESVGTAETSLSKQEENVSINSVHSFNNSKEGGLQLKNCDTKYQTSEANKKSITNSVAQYTKPESTETASKSASIMSITKPVESLISISEERDYIKPFPGEKLPKMDSAQTMKTDAEKTSEKHTQNSHPMEHKTSTSKSLEKNSDCITSIHPTSENNRPEISQNKDRKTDSWSQPSNIEHSANHKMNCEDSRIQPLFAVSTESRRSSIDEERSGMQGALSVSSYTESEGPAEWSIDELDDGDTFFLVTSSGTNGEKMLSGSSTLHSASSDEEFNHTATLLSGSDTLRSSFEIIDEENDTEGDFDDLRREKEDRESCNVGGLKRVVPFPDLSLVRTQNVPSSSADQTQRTEVVAYTTTHTSGKKNRTSKKFTKAKADDSSTDENGKRLLEKQKVVYPSMSMFENYDDEDQGNKNDSSRQISKLQSNLVKDMLPGETFFKTTNCDINFSDEEKPKPVLRKSFPVNSFSNQKNDKELPVSNSVKTISGESDKVGKCKPVPAKRSQPLLQSVPTITVSNFNERDSSHTASSDQNQASYSFSSKPETTVTACASKNTIAKDFVIPEITKSRKGKDTLSKSTGKSPYIDKFGSKVIQTPSGTKLPISPLAKKVDSNENVSQSSASKPADVTSKIWAIQGESYFDNDSEGESTDNEENLEILKSAITSFPVHPKDTNECDSQSLLEQKEEKSPSFFFRRTASTDNFEELLKKTTETPRPRRARQSLSTSNVKKATSLYAEHHDLEGTESLLGRSISLSPPNQKNELETQSLSAVGRRNSEPAIFDEVRKISEGYLHLHNDNETINHSKNNYILNQPSHKTNVKSKNSAVVLSKSQLNKDLSSSPSFCGSVGTSSLPLLARCVSCGVLSQPDDSQTTTKAFSSPTRKETPKVLPIHKSTINSVNSSTQVTPEKEKPPSSLASFDICQLTALIQAFKDSSDRTISDLTSKDTHARFNVEKTYKCTNNSSTTTAADFTTPITREPSSTNTFHQKSLTCDASTETCLDGEPIVLPRDQLMTSRSYVTCCHYYDKPLTRLGKVDIGVDTQGINRDLVYHSPEPFSSFPRVASSSFHRNLEGHTNRSSCYDFTSIRDKDRSPSYHNPSSYYHKDERRFSHLPDHDFYAMMENRSRLRNYPASRWAGPNIPREPYESFYQYHNKPEVDIYQPHSMNYNMEFEDSTRSPFYSSSASADQTRCFSKPNTDRFYSKPFKLERYADYEQQMQLDHLQDIYENEVSRKYAEEIEMRQKTLPKRKKRDHRRHGPGGEKKDFLRFLPNGNFSLRRSASVPTVARSELHKGGPNSRHDGNVKTQNINDHISYLAKDCHPVPPTYRRNESSIDQNAGFSDRFQQHHFSNEALSTHEDSRPDFQSGFSTESSTGTSLSSGAYYLSPPTSPGHRKGQNSSSVTDKRYGSHNARGGGHVQTIPVPNTSAEGHQSVSKEKDTSVRKSARSKIKLPQPPEEDEYRARYHTNKRYNAYSPLRNTSKFSGRSDENVKLEVNQLRQTMEDLDQEEKELDMKLRYLELGRVSKTNSVSSLTGGNAFQSIPTSMIWGNDKTMQNDCSKFRFSNTDLNLEPPRNTNRSLLASHYIDKPLDSSRDNNDVVTYSHAQSGHGQRNYSKAQQQREDYVVVNDVAQIISEKDKDSFKGRREFLDADAFEYASNCEESSPRGKNRKRFSEAQENMLPKYESMPMQNNPRARKYGSSSRSNEHEYRRDARKHIQNESASRESIHQDYYLRQGYSNPGHPTTHNRCHSQSLSRRHQQRNRRNDDPSKDRYPPSDDRVYHAHYAMQDPEDISIPWVRMQNNPLDHGNTFDNSNRLTEFENGLRLKSTLNENMFGIDGKNCPSEKSMLYIKDRDINVRNIYRQIKISKEFATEARKTGLRTNQSVPQDELCYSKNPIETEAMEDCNFSINSTAGDRKKKSKKRCSNHKMACESKLRENELSRNELKQNDGVRIVVSDTEEYHLRKEPNDWFDKPQLDKPENQNSHDYAEFFER